MTGGQTRCVKVCIEKKNYDFVVPISYNSLVWTLESYRNLTVIRCMYFVLNTNYNDY